METTAYILSPAFEFLPATELNAEKLPKTEEVERIFKGELFVLANHHTWHLLNPAIHAFLKAFEKPNTVEEVLKSFSQQINCKQDVIREKVEGFFKSMKRHKIIIPAEQTENGQKSKIKDDRSPLFQQGDLLGSYRIEKRIFHKPSVEIYVAERMWDGMKTAVKALRIPAWKTPRQRKKMRHSFGQEFRLLKEIGRHPNICQLLEFVEKEHHSYAVLELLDDVSLRPFIKKNSLSLEKRIELISQLLEAMSFVHGKGIVHGDIHLSNVLIHRGNKVKLIDFNMSNRLQPAENEIVREGGVYQYIPPEKVDARAFRMVKGMADRCSEVFQLGVVMYYVFYQKMPFEDFTWQKLAIRIAEEKPTFPAQTPIGCEVPGWVLRMMKKSLAKDPAKRFPSAVEQSQKWNSLRKKYIIERDHIFPKTAPAL